MSKVMEKKSACAIYLRVSTLDQNTSLQRVELEEYAKIRSLVISHIYEDKATGTNTNRSEFQRMLKDARSRRFSVLIVWKLDRFGRSLKDLVTHLQELTELGISFISIKDQIDLTTSTGRLMLHIIGAFAQFEADIIRERVRSGVRAKIAKTGRWGRQKQTDDQKVAQLRKEGFSVRQISTQLGVSSTSVMRSLKGVPITMKKKAV